MASLATTHEPVSASATSSNTTNTANGLDAGALALTLQSLRQFAADRLPDKLLLELDARDECPVEIVRAMSSPELGIHLVFIAEEYGGLGGNAFDVYRVCEEMGRMDLGIATAVLATCLGSEPIRVGGTAQQKSSWLSRIASEGMLFAYAATEPEAGSDLAALRSTAEPVTRGDCVVGYKLNGSKQWISNGGIADAYAVLARAPGGPTWFVVEKDTPGLTHGKPEDKHGIRTSNTAALSLDDVYVGSDHMVGGVEGQGLIQAQAVFGYTRLMVAGFALGAGWAALDRAIPYARERIQAGSPLSEKQGYTHKLIVPHIARLEACRAYIEETAARIDAREGALNTEGAIAKYMASEIGNRAADAAMQALGGYGYTREYRLEKIKRDVRITTIYEGTSEIMEMTISRDRWQAHLKSRAEYYHQEARRMEALHTSHPAAGAQLVGCTLHALAEILERARLARLTRHQHILMKLGEWMAWAECAAAMARRAGAMADGRISEKSVCRFDAKATEAISRIFAREAALHVATDALRYLAGSSATPDTDIAGLHAGLNLAAIHRGQAGYLADMDYLADVVFARDATSPKAEAT